MVNKTKQIQQLMPQKPAPAQRPLTKEEQAQQIARFFTQKREAFFQGILYNVLQNATLKDAGGNIELKPAVDAALAAADYAIQCLYPLPEEKPQEEAEK